MVKVGMRFIMKLDEITYVEIEATNLSSAREKYEELRKELDGEDIDVGKEEHKVRIRPPKGLYEHLTKLKEEGFFAQPRTLSDIKNKLKEFAVHYPSSTFPSYLNRLLGERILRRFKQKSGKGEVWTYVNY